ncbi:MAG: serine/threonine protein kinase, partial [Deltaproteobacteria bacterium]
MSDGSLPNVLSQRFQLGDRIAAGQSGATYRALEAATQRRGALKLIEAARAWTAAERGRVGRELEKLATLRHPYLAEVYATGVADDVPWVFRVEVEGESLRQKIARGAPYEGALQVVAQLAAALDEVHRAGLLQRDLSPEHVIVQPDGDIRLIDTGVAMRIASASVFEIVGKPAYVSPEHALGKLVSFRSDLYALGCLLFELLTGAPPFVGTADEILEQHRQKPAPALEGQPQVVTALVAQLLQKDPRDRPFSAQQVRRILEPLTGPLGAPQSRPQGGGTLLGLAAVAVPQPSPRTDGTEQLSALDLAGAEALLATPHSDGSAMTQRQSHPPPVPGQKRSVPPPPPRTTVPGQMSAPPSGGLAVPPPPPSQPAAPEPAALDFDDFAETKAVSRDMVNELRALGGLEEIEGAPPATAQPAPASPPAAQASTAPAPGFGAPASGAGFGAPASGFGAPPQQGAPFGPPQGPGGSAGAGGFDAPSSAGAPSGAGGFGAASGGFGVPSSAGAASGAGGFGAPSGAGGFGAASG